MPQNASPPSAKSAPQAAGRAWVRQGRESKVFQGLLSSFLKKKTKQVVVGEVAPAAMSYTAAMVLEEAAEQPKPTRVWLIAPDLRAQEALANELATWHGQVIFFPELEQDRSIQGIPDQDVQAERLAILQRLEKGTGGEVIVLNAASLEEEVPVPSELEKQHVSLKVGQNYPMAKLEAQLLVATYDKVAQVADRGQYAVRGGILDVFSWHAELPTRLEFFDEEIDSIRSFDPDAQTSIRKEKEAHILLNPGLALPTCQLVDIFEPTDWLVGVGFTDHLRLNVVIAEEPNPKSKKANLEAYEEPVGTYGAGDFILQETQQKKFREQLQRWKADDWQTVMFFNNGAEIERFRELMPEDAAPVECRMGELSRGFAIPTLKLAVLCDAELFGRYQTTRARRIFARERQAKARRAPLDLTEMRHGDLVVHLEFGIGKYGGLVDRRNDDGTYESVLVLIFADEAKLYVPLQKAYLVSRYVGLGRASTPLSKLGDGKWAKIKKAAEASIYDYAAELLKIQAERQTGVGYQHAQDTKWQHEFENAFIYKETPDQLKAINDTKADMESPRAMDRLICGDVGFGKTEVAIRAVFKAVMSGKQVAFLAPTTVLAQQHYQTLKERFSDYPVRVEVLHRYRTAAESRKVLQALAEGSVDVCVGTHRLISKDVSYKDLGLVVIDEEQRFGVLHKERFKMIFRLVDVLTLSATPIPRTLYMSLMGARDMSTIDTPPANRIPVETTVLTYDERIIRNAIQRELRRGGQVYFLHNRINTIEKMASKIQSLCPEAKVVIGHGQMEEGVLELVMKAFIEGKANVLVSTTIIESGIDIPNANTIIIDRADRFGLADLYQLRGRVGRAGHKAYAYLMLPSTIMGNTDAKKRITAIRQYTSLGSGFRIAMRDLEIRGAGNLLGTQQSGNVVAIGFDLYCQTLKEAVNHLQGRQVSHRLNVHLDLDIIAWTEAERIQHPKRLPALIPATYIEEPEQRINTYKQVAELTSYKDLQELEKNWRDRFGPMPDEAKALLLTAELRIAAHHNGISSVQLKEDKIMAQRKGDYIMSDKKFPRVKPNRPPLEQLQELLREVKEL
jgi:transcription-repair coupling factor (superfamily II helicase)